MSELFKLKNGTILLSTEAPGGIYNSAQLKKIAELCSKELAIVKATEDQRLALFVKESEIEHVAEELKATGLGFRNYQSGLHQPVSCLGELCETHDQPALTTAMDLTRLMATLSLQSSLKIGINGCARCCTPCHTLDISVIGEPSGYRISLGGKTSQFPELASFFAEAVPAKELPRLIAAIIELFKSKAEEGETLNEVLDRCGVEEFVAALAPYSQDAATRDDPFAPVVAPLEAASDESLELKAIISEPETDLGTDEPGPAHDAEEVSDMIDDNESMDLEFGAEDTGDLKVSALQDDSDMNFDFSDPDVSGGQLDEIPIGGGLNTALNDEILLSTDESPGLDEMNMPGFDPEDVVETEKKFIPESDDDIEVETKEEAAEALDDMAEFEIQDELVFDESAMITDDLLETELLDADLEADVPLLNTEVSDIPELDEDLLQSNEIDTSLLVDDESEGDMMSSEEEQRFEQSIQASIEEDQKMRDDMEEDINQSAREDAFRIMETATEEDGESIPLNKVAPIKSKSDPIQTGSSDFEWDGIDITDRSMRINFSSGAYLDVSLDAIDAAQSKSYRMGGQTVSVSREADGYVLEGDGMRMFYPHKSLRAS